MATLNELFDLTRDQELKERVAAAVILSAINNVSSADVNIQSWAVKAIRSSLTDVDVVVRLLLHTHQDLTKSEILGLTDSAIKTTVDALIPSLAVPNA